MISRKQLLIILIFVINSGIIFSQSNYYAQILKSGNEAFKNGDFIVADSLYSLCIEKSVNGDIFFNRAFARLNLLDTCGYCDNLYFASVFFDKEATRLYSKDCLECADTSFYTNDMIKVNSNSKYRYYEVTLKSLCDSLKYYDFHDKRKKEYGRIINMNNLTSFFESPIGKIDFTARGYYKDSILIFYYIKNVNINEIIDENSGIYLRKCSSYIGNKYQHIKKYENESIKIDLLIDNKGKILEENFIEDSTFNNKVQNFNELKEELEGMFKNISDIKPILFQGKPVFFKGEYSFRF